MWPIRKVVLTNVFAHQQSLMGPPVYIDNIIYRLYIVYRQTFQKLEKIAIPFIISVYISTNPLFAPKILTSISKNEISPYFWLHTSSEWYGESACWLFISCWGLCQLWQGCLNEGRQILLWVVQVVSLCFHITCGLSYWFFDIGIVPKIHPISKNIV